jgi:hypothetical protein
MTAPRILAYYYPGWHFDPLRNPDPGWSEWDAVEAARPRAPWHRPPRPCGRSSDDEPEVVDRAIRTARAYGIDGFVACFYWNRGARVLEAPLRLIRDRAPAGFALGLMWVNRLPYERLPLDPDGDHFAVDGRGRRHVIADGRVVSTSADDFARMLDALERDYFSRPGYLTKDGAPVLQVYSVDDLLQDLGDAAAAVLAEGAARLRRRGYAGLHLVGVVHRASPWLPAAAALGFTSLTSYVFLPDWAGPCVQSYPDLSMRREEDWLAIGACASVPYSPSVAAGWDSSARGRWQPIDPAAPYPWSPVVVDATAEAFRRHLLSGARHAPDGLLRIASWNEWSEGHYLEPDADRGAALLEAVRSVREELAG